MTEEEFISIFKEIDSFTDDLKAETILDQLFQNSSLKNEDVIIKNQSNFNRSYRNDLTAVENIDNEFARMAFHLSRNGIYDLLPEGLFHSSVSNKKGSSYNSKKKELKETEQETRKFFAPIENEFFYQKLKIEQNERDMLSNFYSLEEKFLIDFWKIELLAPKKYLLRLIHILPNSHRIAGNLELTRLSIEKILGERVVFNKKYRPITRKKTKGSDNGVILGRNTILDTEDSIIFEPIIEVNIGPIKPKKIDSFIQKNGILEFMELFYRFFIPLEYEVITNIELMDKGYFILGNPNQSIIGLTTTI